MSATWARSKDYIGKPVWSAALNACVVERRLHHTTRPTTTARTTSAAAALVPASSATLRLLLLGVMFVSPVSAVASLTSMTVTFNSYIHTFGQICGLEMPSYRYRNYFLVNYVIKLLWSS